MTDLLADIIGWSGAALLLLAYYLVSSGKAAGGSIYYQLCNFSGGTLMIINTLYYRSYPPAFVNTIWVLIALLTLLRRKPPDLA